MSQLPFEFCHIDISCSGIKHQNSDSADAGESWQLLFRPDNQSDHISVFFCADFHFVHAGHCHHLEPEPGCHHHSKHHHFRFPGKFRNNTAWFHRYLCRTLSATTMQVSKWTSSCWTCFDECEYDLQINSAASLLSLGTLVTGVPSKTIGKITATDLLQASADTNFISNMLTAPSVIQQTVVQKVHSQLHIVQP